MRRASAAPHSEDSAEDARAGKSAPPVPLAFLRKTRPYLRESGDAASPPGRRADTPHPRTHSTRIMTIHTLRRAALSLLLCGTAIGLAAQDLIARQAPVDRRLRAVDSISIQRAVDRSAAEDYTHDELYTSWVTTKAHPYSSEEVPDSFRIDLRGFCMPTPSRQITSNFGYRPAFRRVHKGLDVKVYTGDTIVAAFDGRVRVVRYDAGGYGNYVVIRHRNGLETIYGHLSKQLVEPDQDVRAGEPIGLGGNTGRSFGSHLHFETRLAGEAIDPALLFDFPAQDVTADFYTFRKASRSTATREMAAAAGPKDSEEVAMTATHFYKVKRGENLATIAKRLGTTADELARNNRLTSKSRIRTGQILRY